MQNIRFQTRSAEFHIDEVNRTIQPAVLENSDNILMTPVMHHRFNRLCLILNIFQRRLSEAPNDLPCKFLAFRDGFHWDRIHSAFLYLASGKESAIATETEGRRTS